MLIELSTLNTPRKPFWEVDSKQPPHLFIIRS